MVTVTWAGELETCEFNHHHGLVNAWVVDTGGKQTLDCEFVWQSLGKAARRGQ
jgi:hypothetical protein